ncbi:hypothetical protein [Polaromonas sp. CG9_12]|nr:hypothetical protein [Polaromonas sp. CG_9.11]MBG6076421.1 hypothetical protein [Polaromonas sp. CG_9.11]CDS50630.1 hypothetical protein [Polaromonas sp. CG9_12]
MSINKAGNLALAANRADDSVIVLGISGSKVELIDEAAMHGKMTH